MLKKYRVVLLAVFFLPLLAAGITDEEKEQYKKTTRQLYLDIKMPGFKTEAFQWALFDEDPSIAYKDGIARMRGGDA